MSSVCTALKFGLALSILKPLIFPTLLTSVTILKPLILQKKDNFSGLLCNIPVSVEATDYLLQEVIDFAYLGLLISVPSELIGLAWEDEDKLQFKEKIAEKLKQFLSH